MSTPGPTSGVDLWWSGKHKAHGGNVQVITDPDGWPLWVSAVRPGRQHDTAAARSHPGLLDSLASWATGGRKVLANLGYLGEATRLTVPHKAVKGTVLSVNQKATNLLHSCIRANGERGNALIKNFKAARRVSLSPEHLGPITAAILVLLHTEHDRTTRPGQTTGHRTLTGKRSVFGQEQSLADFQPGRSELVEVAQLCDDFSHILPGRCEFPGEAPQRLPWSHGVHRNLDGHTRIACHSPPAEPDGGNRDGQR